MTIDPWLLALIVLFAFAAGVVLQSLVVALTGGPSGGMIDLSERAARGQLPDLREREAGR